MTSFEQNQIRRSRDRQLSILAVCGFLILAWGGMREVSNGRVGVWMAELINLTPAQAHDPIVEALSLLVRKFGHFVSYGVLGVMFARSWKARLWRVHLKWTTVQMRGASMGVACAFAVACADEFHQRFLPFCTPSLSDVAIDVTGAVVFNALLYGFLVLRRRNALNLLKAIRQCETRSWWGAKA